MDAETQRRLDQTLAENRALRAALAGHGATPDMVGVSRGMQEIRELVDQISPHNITVLITGESGVGKERVADAIHAGSPRKDAAFVKVNCAALPPTLVESELFGHRRGAFTGATADRAGRFEEAHGGTLLLDEVGDLPLPAQAKLLRALETGEIQRLGADAPNKVDVRILASTNRDVEAEVGAGHFREDLYYRLAVVRMHVPPLRDRPSDIPALVTHFLEGFALESRAMGRAKPVPSVSDAAMNALIARSWRGNVRELMSVLRLAFIRASTGEPLGPEHLEPPRRRERQGVVRTLAEVEREAIHRAVVQANGNMGRAAQMLGIARSTLWRKLKKLERSG
jgi:two-component system response regulator HydG